MGKYSEKEDGPAYNGLVVNEPRMEIVLNEKTGRIYSAVAGGSKMGAKRHYPVGEEEGEDNCEIRVQVKAQVEDNNPSVEFVKDDAVGEGKGGDGCEIQVEVKAQIEESSPSVESVMDDGTA